MADERQWLLMREPKKKIRHAYHVLIAVVTAKSAAEAKRKAPDDMCGPTTKLDYQAIYVRELEHNKVYYS